MPRPPLLTAGSAAVVGLRHFCYDWSGGRSFQVNPAPAPSKQRMLVELSGHWPDYEPMTTADFEPLTADSPA